jgi:hypothetical protein
VIDRPIHLDVDANVAAVEIGPTGMLIFDAKSSRTLSSAGNVVVRGVLRMRPGSSSVRHVLRFTGVDESRFVGGGMKVLDTDVGLWCMGDGLLDVVGSTKTSWSRAAGGVRKGSRVVQLQAVPVGWRPGDELALVPSGTWGHDTYDYATITSISGRTVNLSSPTRFDHPEVDVGQGFRCAPEVLNLTRNAVIQGTAAGRAHIFVMSTQPQRMAYCATRWMGPRQRTGESDFTRSVVGRYPLHLHMNGNRSRGSHMVGVLVRDAGSHAFVAHESHGVTFTSCVSHDTFDSAYWWDQREFIGAPSPLTHDVSYLGCVASLVKADPPFRGQRISGFSLGAGSGNRVNDCVSVGVQGNREASGFIWPEGSSSVWQFRRCVSHNNKVHGIFTWQNNGNRHVVEDFVCANNGGAGVSHGAYLTGYVYRNAFLYRNGGPSVLIHSNSRSDRVQRFERLHCEAVGISDHAIAVTRHSLEPLSPTQIVGCTFSGQRKQAVAMTYDFKNGDSTKELFDIVECASSTPLLWLSDKTKSGSVIRVQDRGTAVRATIKGTSGTHRPEWNAVVNPIAKFSSEPAGQTATPFPLLAAATAPSG